MDIIQMTKTTAASHSDIIKYETIDDLLLSHDPYHHIAQPQEARRFPSHLGREDMCYGPWCVQWLCGFPLFFMVIYSIIRNFTV